MNPRWPTTRIARGDLAAEIAAIKDEPGPDVMVHGGAGFAAALAAQGLIDEYCLVIQPAAIGSGQGLFAKLTSPLHLELIEARSFECGVVTHIYRPRPGSDGSAELEESAGSSASSATSGR